MPREAARFYNPVTCHFINSGHYRADSTLRLRDSKLLEPELITKLTTGSDETVPSFSVVVPPEGLDTDTVLFPYSVPTSEEVEKQPAEVVNAKVEVIKELKASSNVAESKSPDVDPPR